MFSGFGHSGLTDPHEWQLGQLIGQMKEDDLVNTIVI